MKINKKNIGFVGGGLMAEALIKGIIAAGLYSAARIKVADPSPQRRELLSREYGVATVAGAEEIWGECPVVILAVKPQVVEPVLRGAASQINARHLLISIAAGVAIARMAAALAPTKARIIRVMPNTPAMVLAGASALSRGEYADEADLALAEKIFTAVGQSVVVDEAALDAVTGLSGSGPAYVFTFFEALIDAGVKVGLPRPTAELLARQTILGSIKLAAESGRSPAELRAMVTSPGGTTIAGLHALERGAFRSLVMDAVEAATRRSVELGQVSSGK